MASGRLKSVAPTPREYQSAIAKSVLSAGSTLVVLPTGLGKTLVAFLVAQQSLSAGEPVLFCAPTKPLAIQHEKTAREMLDLEDGQIALITGATDAKKRKALYPAKGSPTLLVFSTPQTVKNDLEKHGASFPYSLVVFDEVHRAVGKYAYAAIAEEAKKSGALVLGLTASPGGQKKKIEEMMALLGVKNVQIRTHEDPDVAPYVKPMDMGFVEVDLPEGMEWAKNSLRDMIGEKMNTLRKMGFVGRFASKKGLAELRARILASNSPLRFSALSQHATLFSLVHCLELLETQGTGTLLKFYEKVKGREPSKAQQRLLNDKRFVTIMEKMKGADEHPKLAKLGELLGDAAKANPAHKAIVFCQYRDQAKLVAEMLGKNGIKAFPFMGKKDGVTAAMQKETLEKFRIGEFDVLVATSIGEEGLDIPSVDSVIFYEPVPSEIRSIQRRGRAGRAKVGSVTVLVTRGTQDQTFFWAARRREEKMKRIVGRMAGKEVEGKPKTTYTKLESAGKNETGKERGEGKEEKKELKNEKKTAKGEKKEDAHPSPMKAGQTKMSDFF